jgi:hypothetical protein
VDGVTGCTAHSRVDAWGLCAPAAASPRRETEPYNLDPLSLAAAEEAARRVCCYTWSTWWVWRRMRLSLSHCSGSGGPAAGGAGPPLFAPVVPAWDVTLTRTGVDHRRIETCIPLRPLEPQLDSKPLITTPCSTAPLDTGKTRLAHLLCPCLGWPGVARVADTWQRATETKEV